MQVRSDRFGIRHTKRHQLATRPDHVRGPAARLPVTAARRRHEVRPVVRRPSGRFLAGRPGPRLADVLVARLVHIVHIVQRRWWRWRQRQRARVFGWQTGLRPEPAADLPVDEESSPRTE